MAIQMMYGMFWAIANDVVYDAFQILKIYNILVQHRVKKSYLDE